MISDSNVTGPADLRAKCFHGYGRALAQAVAELAN